MGLFDFIDKPMNYLRQNPVTSIAVGVARIALNPGEVLQSAAEHIVDNYIFDTVKPIRGSIVYCELASTLEHSGVYVGDNMIVHLDGDGDIKKSTPSTFLNRLGGINPALTIYVSCLDTKAQGNDVVAERALNMVGSKRNYNLIMDNCHQFTSGCLKGNFENADNFWWMLKHSVEKEYRVNCWRAWEL